MNLVRLPMMPENALFAMSVEVTGSRLITITGWLRAGQYPFVLRGETQSTYVVRIPRLVYRATWNEARKNLEELAVAILAPDPNKSSTRPLADEPLFRYPFSNVYAYRGGVVCWPTLGRINMRLDEVESRGVRGFLSMPNNADLFGLSQSHNAPYREYPEYLRAIVDNDGLEKDWLIPHQLNVEQFHNEGGRP
jgi:hypothetical protein